MKVAIIGATGLVGSVLLKVLEERNLPVSQLIPVASAKSVGAEILFKNKNIKVVSLTTALEEKPQIAIFSAGGTISKLWAEKFAAIGTFVIDNSAAWRMDTTKKLIVPEINGAILTSNDKIIANPNCSTVQMVLALAPLHKKYRIKRIVVATYQSVSGTGIKAIQQMDNERNGIRGEQVYPHPIDKNCFPHGGDFDANGDTTEETKLRNETRKILGDSTINLTATVVRIPVLGGHSEAVNVAFYNDFDTNEIKQLLGATSGVILQDNPAENDYPTPQFCKGKDEVFVGRIRRDLSQPNTLNLWVVADNLRKGAATNAVQIAQVLVKKKFVV